MKNSVFNGETLTCQCGESTNTDLKSSIISSSSVTSDMEEFEGSQVVDCKSCGKSYELSAVVEVSFDIISASANPIAKLVADMDGEFFSLDTLMDMDMTSSVPIEDGTYLVQGKEYTIENGVLTSIWAKSNEDQLELFEGAAV